ncbi:MAG: leucine-rich repeat protein [Eubacteriales bacterium]|nr:leucine-rich repeat protein [Eubacteriales bacterium]
MFLRGGVLTVSSDSGTTAWRYDKQIGKDEVRRVILENGVKNIENSAFYNCINLESVDFSGCTDLETIDDQVFRGCGKLKSIDLSACKKLNRIGKIVFWECSELESVNLSGCSRLQIIDNNAFYKCTQLNSINFSGCSGLETIKNLVFWYCSSLTSIDLSDCTNLEAIGNQTFRECSELASIDLSDCSKLDSIDDQAFAQCIKLKELRLGGNSAPSSLGGHLFRGVPGGFHVHVPENASGYNASDWSPGTLVYGSVDLNSSKVDIVFLDSQNNSVTDAEYGEVITFRANVRDELQNTPASDGSVTFKAGTALSDTKQIVQGSAVSKPVTLTGDSWKPGDYTIRAEYSGGTGLLPNDTANKLLTIKRAGRTISLSDSVSVNETDVTLNNAVLSEGKNDGTVQYGYSLDKDSQAVKNWQNSPVFTGLESGKTYYFFASVSEGTYYGKAVSSGVEVTIPIYEGIWVNNVNLLRDQDHTIACGNGTASFNPDTNILTLENATIDKFYNNFIGGVYPYPYIWLDTTMDCTVELKGVNHIGKTGDPSREGIMAKCNLTITGTGSLEIEAAGKTFENRFYGIHTVNSHINIQDTVITMKNEII